MHFRGFDGATQVSVAFFYIAGAYYSRFFL